MDRTVPEGMSQLTSDFENSHHFDSQRRNGYGSVARPKCAPLLVASLLTVAIAQSLIGGGSIALAEATSPTNPAGPTPVVTQVPTLQMSSVNTPSMLTHAISVNSSREHIAADHREVDSMAVRIKEMINARYRAEAVLFKNTQDTIAALKQRITELEQRRHDADGKYDALLAERKKLNQQLSLVQAERDSARDDIDVLAGQVENQRGTVETLRADIVSAADQLTNRETVVNGLKEKLDVQQISGEQLKNSLAATEDKLTDKNHQLALAEEHLADTRQQLGDLRGQLSDLRTDRKNALNEIASIRIERDTADKRASDLLSERNNLTDKLGLFKSRSTNVKSALKEEQQQHAKSRAVVAALEDEIESLQGDVNAKTSYRDKLLAEKESLEEDKVKLASDLDTVNGKLQLANKELRSRQIELKTALDNLEDVTDQLDVAKAELESLNGLLASANDEIGKLNAHTGKLEIRVASLSTDHDQARASISSLKSNGSTLQKKIDRRDEDISTLEAQLAELQRVKSNLLAEGERTTKTMENLHNQIASLEHTEKVNADKLAALKGQNDVLQRNALEEAGDLQQQLANAEGQLRSASAQLNALSREKQTVEAERDAVLSETERLRLALTDELRAAQLENVTVQSSRSDNSIPLRLGNADFFAVGSAKLTKEGGENLKKLAEIINSFQARRIVVEGHTDNVQIGYRLKPIYATNWELSVARAAAAVRHMQYQSNIDPHQLSAVGYGEYAPVASNDTPDGRQMNRRVEVVLYPREVTGKLFSAMDE